MPPDDYDRTKNGYVSNAPPPTLDERATALRRACAEEDAAVREVNRANAAFNAAKLRRERIDS